MEKILISSLDKIKKGDIVSFKKDSEGFRLHSFEIVGGRIIVHKISFLYTGPILSANSCMCQWVDESDPEKIPVYVKKEFKISNSEKYKGRLYLEWGGTMSYVGYEVNDINIIK